MEKLRILLERYSKGIATTAEMKMLLDKLSMDEKELCEALKMLFEKSMVEEEKLLNNSRSREIFERIRWENTKYDKVKIKKNVRIIRFHRRIYKWAVAASILGVLFWGKHLFIFKNEPGKSVVAAVVHSNNLPEEKSIFNATNQVRNYKLDDGTTVSLAPGSVFTYKSFSGLAVRSVTLTGEAKFRVTHDDKHPFIVNANGIVVTDLGTVFSINSCNEKVVVRLFEGKVLIHPSKERTTTADTYLKPGEQFRLSVANGKFAVSNFENNGPKHLAAKDIVSPGAGKALLTNKIDKLVFDQTPLKEVFDSLSQMYGRHIRYRLNEIKSMSFSGKVIQTDSLGMILKVICNTNDLGFKDSRGDILIYK